MLYFLISNLVPATLISQKNKLHYSIFKFLLVTRVTKLLTITLLIIILLFLKIIYIQITRASHVHVNLITTMP